MAYIYRGKRVFTFLYLLLPFVLLALFFFPSLTPNQNFEAGVRPSSPLPTTARALHVLSREDLIQSFLSYPFDK